MWRRGAAVSHRLDLVALMAAAAVPRDVSAARCEAGVAAGAEPSAPRRRVRVVVRVNADAAAADGQVAAGSGAPCAAGAAPPTSAPAEDRAAHPLSLSADELSQLPEDALLRLWNAAAASSSSSLSVGGAINDNDALCCEVMERNDAPKPRRAASSPAFRAASSRGGAIPSAGSSPTVQPQRGEPRANRRSQHGHRKSSGAWKRRRSQSPPHVDAYEELESVPPLVTPPAITAPAMLSWDDVRAARPVRRSAAPALASASSGMGPQLREHAPASRQESVAATAAAEPNPAKPARTRKDPLDVFLEQVVTVTGVVGDASLGGAPFRAERERDASDDSAAQGDDGWSVLPPRTEAGIGSDDAALATGTGVGGRARSLARSASASRVGARSERVLGLAPELRATRAHFSTRASNASSPSAGGFRRVEAVAASGAPARAQPHPVPSAASPRTSAAAQPSAPAAPRGGKVRDDEWYLGAIVDRLFAELATDGHRLPVTKVVSYLFDGAGGASATATEAARFAGDSESADAAPSGTIEAAAVPASPSPRASPASGFTAQQLASFFAPAKPLSFVPASVKREVRERLAQRRGLLRFVEQHLSDRYAIAKDPATSELALTICGHDAFHSGNSQAATAPAGAGGGAASAVAAAAAAPWSNPFAADAARPWGAAQQRRQVALTWEERAPVTEADVHTFTDMLAARARPIYGDEWSLDASGYGGRVMRTDEVADLFAEHVPTFWVREKLLARALGDRFPDVLDELALPAMEALFERYPRVFELFHEGDARQREVRLAPTLQHPRRGAADRAWQLRASPHAEEERARAEDAAFADVLLRNLPPDGRFVFLPEWLGDRISPADRALVNSAPPQRVLTVLHQYAGLFHVRGDEPPAIQRVTALPATAAAAAAAAAAAPPAADDGVQASAAATAATRTNPTGLGPEFQIWVRRRPAHLAPRCLGEHDVESSPAPTLARFLVDAIGDIERQQRAAAAAAAAAAASDSTSTSAAKSGSLGSGGDAATSSAGEQADASPAWVPVQQLYTRLSAELRLSLRPFTTLAKFLRLHGQAFCVSADLVRVALHRWDGASQAFATIDTLLGEEEVGGMRMLADAPFKPRTRKQLSHLEPDHPYLNRAVLQQAVHDALPPDRAVLVSDVFRHLLPPEAWAALPTRNPHSVLMSTPLLTVWKAHGADGRRHLMIQRGSLGAPPPGMGVGDCASREEVVAQLQQLLSHHPAGVSQRVLYSSLRWDAVVGVRTHFRNLDACLKAYAQLFTVEYPPPSLDPAEGGSGSDDAIVRLNNVKKFM